MRHLVTDELASLLKTGRMPPLAVLEQRRKFSAFISTNQRGKITDLIYYGKQAQSLWRGIFGKQQMKEIAGQVASAPLKKVSGEVCLILDVHKKKFKRGAILVTTMTRPDFVPILHQAKAIITDEGGLTCHAAIISRELGIPCIIGTKVASKVLQSGDKVEMDLMNGVVKKL